LYNYRKKMTAKKPSRININIPEKELEDFCRRYQVQKLAFFGSVLGRNFRAESDVDVLVSFQPGARVGFITFSRMQRELSGLFRRPVDLVPMDGLKPVIRDSVLSNIDVVYAA
jgi:predicted nucleotidyltransferase